MDGRREGRNGKCVLRVGSSVTNTCQQGGNHRAHTSLPAAGDPVLEAGCKSLLPGITTSVFHSSHLQQRFRTENIYWFILPHIRGDSSHIFHVFVENAITKHRLHPEVTAASLNSLYCCLKKKSLITPQMNMLQKSLFILSFTGFLEENSLNESLMKTLNWQRESALNIWSRFQKEFNTFISRVLSTWIWSQKILCVSTRLVQVSNSSTLDLQED